MGIMDDPSLQDQLLNYFCGGDEELREVLDFAGHIATCENHTYEEFSSTSGLLLAWADRMVAEGRQLAAAQMCGMVAALQTLCIERLSADFDPRHLKEVEAIVLAGGKRAN